MDDSVFATPLADVLPLPLLVVTASGIVEEWNPAAEVLLGWSRQEAVGQLFPAVSPDSLKLLLDREMDSGLCRVSRKDGSRVEVRIWRRVLAHPDGNRNLLLLLAESVKRDKGRVRDSDLLRAIMTGIPDNLYFKDLDSRFIKISQSLAHWFRLNEPGDAVGKSDFDFFTREHAEEAFEDERTVMGKGQPLIGKEEKETWPNGTTTRVSTTKIPLCNREGETIGTFGISRDITQHRLAEQALRESEQRFRALLRNAGEVIGIVETDGTARYISDSLKRVLGYSPEELLGLSAFEIVHPADLPAVTQAFSELVKRAGLRRVQCQVRHKDGRWRVCDITATNMLDDPALHGIVVNVSDISEFLRMEGELEQTSEELEISREDLRRLSARLESALEEERRRIAHELHDELGQSLTALRMEVSSLANTSLAEGRSDVGQRLTSLAKMVSGALETIRRISHELRPAVLDHLGLEPALEWQCREFETHSRIHCLFRSDISAVQVDQECSIALFRILQEALTNVARHARASEVNVILGLRQSSLVMEVRDDGQGIDTSRLGGGSSLGILGMRERAGRLSGQFTISGAPGHGTTVEVKIPLVQLSGKAVQTPPLQ